MQPSDVEPSDVQASDVEPSDVQASEMDPQARAAVRRQERFPIPHTRLGVRLVRWLTRPVVWLQNRDNPPVGRTVDGTIPGPEGPLEARLYLPDDDPPFPTVVFFHGGGYVFGSIETHDWLCRHLTRESGCGVLSVEYRLAPEHPFPAPVEDAWAAVEWAADNPDSVAGDGQLAVMGDSAGGTLAAVTGLMAADRGGPSIDHQVLVYPAIGVEPAHDSVQEHAGTVLDEADIAFFRTAYLPSEIHERNPYADPSNACDLSDVAPASVLTAGFDPLRDGGIAYAEQLAADGVPTNHENYPDLPHGFMSLPDVDRTHDAITDVATDLRSAFHD